jgi:glycosyl transferase, family 25
MSSEMSLNKATPNEKMGLGKPPRTWIAVVNLETASERRENMEREFTKCGISANFFPAVNAREDSSREKMSGIPDYGPWGAVQPHDKACTLSHVELLKAFLDREGEYCLVLEDDVYLSADLKTWIEDLSWWPEEADLVKIERWRDDRLKVIVGKRAKTFRNRSITKLYSRHSGTAGYFVSRVGAKKIVDAKQKCFPADHLLFNVNASPLAKSLNVYQVNPALSVQGNDPKIVKKNSGPMRGVIKENVAMREIKRGLLELSLVPTFLWLIVSGQAKNDEVKYLDS